MKTSAEIKAELDATLQRRDELRKEAKAMEARQAEIIQQLRLIEGGWRERGAIQVLEADLAAALRMEADAALPAVRWKVPPGVRWNQAEPDEYVVSKVTARRIYIRTRGGMDEEIYNRDGTSPKSYVSLVIDVENTEGLS